MALRFNRRIRIAPGISLNLSKSGIGASIGPRGAKINISSRGVYGNVGLPVDIMPVSLLPLSSVL